MLRRGGRLLVPFSARAVDVGREVRIVENASNDTHDATLAPAHVKVVVAALQTINSKLTANGSEVTPPTIAQVFGDHRTVVRFVRSFVRLRSNTGQDFPSLWRHVPLLLLTTLTDPRMRPFGVGEWGNLAYVFTVAGVTDSRAYNTLLDQAFEQLEQDATAEKPLISKAWWHIVHGFSRTSPPFRRKDVARFLLHAPKVLRDMCKNKGNDNTSNGAAEALIKYNFALLSLQRRLIDPRLQIDKTLRTLLHGLGLALIREAFVLQIENTDSTMLLRLLSILRWVELPTTEKNIQYIGWLFSAWYATTHDKLSMDRRGMGSGLGIVEALWYSQYPGVVPAPFLLERCDALTDGIQRQESEGNVFGDESLISIFIILSKIDSGLPIPPETLSYLNVPHLLLLLSKVVKARWPDFLGEVTVQQCASLTPTEWQQMCNKVHSLDQ